MRGEIRLHTKAWELSHSAGSYPVPFNTQGSAGTTLRILQKEKDTIYPAIEKSTRQIAEAVRNTLGDKVHVNQIGSLMSVFFTEQEVVDMDTSISSDTARYARYFSYMLDNGIYLAPSQFEAMFVSYAHSREDIARTCELIRAYKEN